MYPRLGTSALNGPNGICSKSSKGKHGRPQGGGQNERSWKFGLGTFKRVVNVHLHRNVQMISKMSVFPLLEKNLRTLMRVRYLSHKYQYH